MSGWTRLWTFLTYALVVLPALVYVAYFTYAWLKLGYTPVWDRAIILGGVILLGIGGVTLIWKNNSPSRHLSGMEMLGIGMVMLAVAGFMWGFTSSYGALLAPFEEQGLYRSPRAAVAQIDTDVNNDRLILPATVKSPNGKQETSPTSWVVKIELPAKRAAPILLPKDRIKASVWARVGDSVSYEYDASPVPAAASTP